MSAWKFGIVAVVVGALALVGYDGIHVLNARRDVSGTASEAASAAAHAIASNKDRGKARAVADAAAKSHGDVVTVFNYDPVAAEVRVTVSGRASSIVLHYVDPGLTNNIRASSAARPD